MTTHPLLDALVFVLVLGYLLAVCSSLFLLWYFLWVKLFQKKL